MKLDYKKALVKSGVIFLFKSIRHRILVLLEHLREKLIV